MSPAISSATPADAAVVSDIYNWYIANTVVTFEVEPVSAAEMAQRIGFVLAAHDWILLERAGEPLGYAYAARYYARAAYRYSAETTIYLRHRPVRLAGNPLFIQRDEERRLLEESVEKERAALAEANGNHHRLQNQLTALLSFARCMFHKEAALRRDQGRQKRLMLDQISEQLRTQLQSMENGRTTGAELVSHNAAPERQNGQ